MSIDPFTGLSSICNVSSLPLLAMDPHTHTSIEVVPKPLGYVIGEQLKNLFSLLYSKLPTCPLISAQACPLEQIILTSNCHTLQGEINMTPITKEQMRNYVHYDIVNINDPSYLEANTLKKQEKNRPYGSGNYQTDKKIGNLFIQSIRNYMTEATTAEHPQHQAFLYGHAREISSDDFLKYNAEAKELRKAITFEEAIACRIAQEKIDEIDAKASLLFKSAFLLAKKPTELPNELEEIPEQYEEAALSWEMFGDILAYHETISIPFYAQSFFLGNKPVSYPKNPKYTAAGCYEFAAYAMRNANYIKKSKEKNYVWNNLDTRRIELLDKSIATLESLALKTEEIVFNADYFEMLAGLYQFKINTYKVSKKDAPNISELQSKVHESRIKSANIYEQLIEKHPNVPLDFYYKKAFNLFEAAFHMKTIGEAHPLLEKAATTAGIFREKRNLPLFPTGWETDNQRNALSIIYAYKDMDKKYEERGPDHLL